MMAPIFGSAVGCIIGYFILSAHGVPAHVAIAGTLTTFMAFTAGYAVGRA